MNKFFNNPAYDSIKSLLLLVLVVGAGYFIGSYAIGRSDFLRALVNPGDTESINITLTSIPDAEPVEPGIFGVGIAKTYEEFSTEEGWLETLTDLIEESNATVIRYPVGGEVKWHHVWTDHLDQDLLASESANLKIGPTGVANEIPGLGELYADRAYEELELGNDGEINELMGNKSKYNSYPDLNSDGAKSFFDFQWSQVRNFVHDMIDIHEDTDTSMLYVVNTRYATPEAVAQEVDYLLDQGVDIQGYECDNEVYSFYRDIYPGTPAAVAPTAVEAYLDTCDTYKDTILDVDPGAVFAVAAAPKKGFEEGGDIADTDSDWNGQWNAALSEMMDDHGYDNYVMHFYHGFFPCIDEIQTENQNSIFSCGIEEMRNFDTMTPPTLESQITSLPPILDHFAALFPGKNMWLTEWNINQDPTRTNGLYANSVLHGVFTQEFLNLLNDANVRHGNYITYATYHTFGTDGGNAMVNKRSGGAGGEPADVGNFVRRTPFFAYKAMQDIYNETFTPLAATFTASGLFNEDDMTLYAYKNGSGDILLSFTNTTDRTVVIDSITLDGETVDLDASSANGYFVDGNDTGASRGKTEFAKNPGNEVVIRDESYTSIANAFLPGYGFGTFSFDPTFVAAPTPLAPSPDDNTSYTEVTKTYATTPTGTELKFDLSTPDDAENPLPLVFFLHGGQFGPGGTNAADGYIDDFTGAGYAVAEVGYRAITEGGFPLQLEDIKGAIRYARAHAEELNIDPDRISVLGTSSGGMIMTLVGTTGDEATLEGSVGGNTGFSSRPNAVINLFGSIDPANPFNLATSVATGFKDWVGCAPEDACPEIQDAIAANYADASDPAFLTIHGTEDTQVMYENSPALDAILDAAGMSSTLIAASGIAHDKNAILTNYMGDIVGFLDAKLYDASYTPPEECGFLGGLLGTCDEGGTGGETYEFLGPGLDDWTLCINGKEKHNKYNRLYEGSPLPITLKVHTYPEGDVVYQIDNITTKNTVLNDHLAHGQDYTLQFVGGDSIDMETNWEVSTILTIINDPVPPVCGPGDDNGGFVPDGDIPPVETDPDPILDTSAPSVPSGLALTDVGYETASFSWNTSSDDTGVVAYEVYKDGNITLETANTSASINDLASGTNYSFTVAARDAAGNLSGASTPLSITTTTPPKACNDGSDNDSDGLVDMADNNCTSPTDDDETGPPPVSPKECNDGVDNDGDDDIDDADPGCSSDNDNSENSDGPEKQCEDETDNDGDGTIDMSDEGCSNASDNSENSDGSSGGGGGGSDCSFLDYIFGGCGDGGGGGGGAADNTDPTVSITSPGSGANMSGPAQTISANASDNVAIEKVEFYVAPSGSSAYKLLGSDTSSPYKYIWSIASIPNGNYQLKTRAYDTSGNDTYSDIISVTK